MKKYQNYFWLINISNKKENFLIKTQIIISKSPKKKRMAEHSHHDSHGHHGHSRKYYENRGFVHFCSNSLKFFREICLHPWRIGSIPNHNFQPQPLREPLCALLRMCEKTPGLDCLFGPKVKKKETFFGCKINRKGPCSQEVQDYEHCMKI